MAEWSSHYFYSGVQWFEPNTKELTCLVQPQYIIRTNVPTKLNEEFTINVTLRVLTMFYSKNPRSGGHGFQPTETIFELLQDIIETHLLTKVLKSKIDPLHCGHVFQATETIFKLVKDIRTNVLTKFHEYWTIKVTFRVLTKKNACPLAAMLFNQPKPLYHEANLQTKFHEDGIINMATRVLTREKCPAPWWPFLTKFHAIGPYIWPLGCKNAPPNGGHVFQSTGTIFELVQDIIGTILVTRFHEDKTIHVTSRVLTRKMHRPTDIIVTNLLTKFHDGRTKNVASRVLTRKNAPPPGAHVFQPTQTIFKLFHKGQTINVASREKCPAPGGHVFQATGTIIEFVQDIIGTNLLTKYHDDRTINVATKGKMPRPLGGYVFQPTGTIFELIQDIIDRTINVASRVKCSATWWPYIIGTNLLTMFHDDRKIHPYRENAPPPVGHVFQPTGIIFEFFHDIIGMNLLTKFHDDGTKNVASRVLKMLYYSHIRKNSPPLGSHVFQANTNLLTKLHEDWIMNVASRVLTRQMFTPHDGRRTKGDHKSSPWAHCAQPVVSISIFVKESSALSENQN
ncbi:hypothetical protein DPMN_028944 [Dreissena polymorpha]|uniref:Uncharacterized protein n=1 Tax=Dreissena polymorpha TaxID=45954 RepID=A0A9D4LVL2_DREPO|nr:hypothetical protein DPMN_028944 [Dreissena polymorpha]